MTRHVASFDVLRAYLEKRGQFTEQDFAVVRECFTPATFEAGEFVQRAGEVATCALFVAKGCLRSYVIDAKGKEHVVQFAPEEWWLADTTSLTTGAPSQYFFQAIESSDVLLETPAGHRRLLATVKPFAEGFAQGVQKHAAAKDRRIVSALSTSAEERYLAFLQDYPSIAERVPQWMVASYLGLTPETLSRIRKARSRK